MLRRPCPRRRRDGSVAAHVRSRGQEPGAAGKHPPRASLHDARDGARYALERLEESGELERLRRRHACYYLELAEEDERASRGPLQGAWLDLLETEHDNLRAVLATPRGDTELGLRLTGALSHFWYMREHHSESRMWLKSALERSGDATAARAKVLVGAARLAWFQGELVRANALAEESLALYRDPGDDAGAAFARLVLGRTEVSRGNRPQGEALVGESLASFRQQKNMWGISRALVVLGAAALFEVEIDRATANFQKSLAVCRDIEDAEGPPETP
jgi:tetratricopeptide (TPR) repeat protein